jgi:glycine reductase
MRLEMRSYPVDGVVWGDETRLDGAVLTVDRGELARLADGDPRIASVSVDLVAPGEAARVIHVCDAIEPRVKVAGRGGCYPGVLGPVETVGTGVTHRLDGLAVVVSAEYPRQIATGTGAALEAILEMSGPGAVGPLSDTRNVVLSIRFADGHGVGDYHDSLRRLGFGAAHRLAMTTVDLPPRRATVFELSPPEGELPRVVYVHQSLSQLNLPVPFISWYGNAVTDWMPIWAHPNELLDGALLPGALGGHAAKPTSWEHVNHPVVSRLYADHGSDLDFAGVIFQRTRFETFEEKQLSANQAAKLAALMGADGAIITWIGAGNAFVEAMLTAQALEREGIKTVFMTYEHGGKGGAEAPLMFTVPEADAIVSTGSLDRPITLPAVERAIGGPDLSVSPEAGGDRVPACDEIALEWRLPLLSAVDHWGFRASRCFEH